MRPVVKGLLLSLSVISIIYIAGCSSTPDLTEYFNDQDTTAFMNGLQNYHSVIRLQILQRLAKYLKIKASGEPGSELYGELVWLTSLYYGNTGVRDLSYRLTACAGWNSPQSKEISKLRQSQALLLRGRATMSLFELRLQLEDNLNRFAALGDSIYMAVVIKDIAQAFETHNEIDSAVCYYQECIALCRRLDYYSLMGNCEMLLGRIYNYRLADYLKSGRAYGNAIRNFRKVDDEPSITYVQLGRVYDFLQIYQTETAIDLIHDILPGIIERGDQNNEAYCYYFLSVAYHNLNSLDSALYFGERSVKLRQRLASKNQSYLSNLGYSLSQLGLVHQNRGDNHKALELFRSADDVFSAADDSAGTAVNLIGWGNYFIENENFDSARVKFEKISGNENFYENYVFSRYGLAICDYYQGMSEQAMVGLKNCIWLVEHANRKLPVPELKTGILSDKIGIYNFLSVLYIDLYNASKDMAFADSAFQYMERSKSRALIENLSGEFHQPSDSIENRYLYFLAKAHKAGRESDDPDAVNKIIHDLEDSLILRYLERPNAVENDIRNYAEIAMDITAFRKELRDDKTILLEYLLSPIGNYLFLIGREDLDIIRIDVDFDSLQSLIDHYLLSIEIYPGHDDNETDYRKIGKDLYSLLIPDQKLSDGGKERLIISSSGPLHYLPLESLIDQNDRFLVEKYDISYIPSATIYRLIGEKGQKPARPMAVAFASSPPAEIDRDSLPTGYGRALNQYYGATENLTPLPSCSVEVRILADCFGLDKVKIFMGDQSTETNFKATNFSNTDYLHIAAHGMTDDRFPNRSAIILSTVGDDNNDGFLRPREIVQMDIPVRMVFLSSCRSGRGKSFPGEGVFNLARPLLIAGSNSVIATYWNINDMSTAQFVQYFYKNLKDGQTQAHALAMAKRQFIQSPRSRLRHPYFWAPFILIGS